MLFQPSDGLDPIVIQKLNHNFRQSRIKGGKGDRGPVGPPGTTNYPDLTNKPSIEGVTLVGNRTFPDLTIFIDPDDDPVTEHPSSDDYALTSSEITALWNAAS